MNWWAICLVCLVGYVLVGFFGWAVVAGGALAEESAYVENSDLAERVDADRLHE